MRSGRSAAVLSDLRATGVPASGFRSCALISLRRLPLLRQAVEHEGAGARDRNPLLRERVAVADGDRLVLDRLLVDREGKGCADLVLTPVAPPDLSRVVVLRHHRPAELLVQVPCAGRHLGVSRDERKYRRLHGCDIRMEPEYRARTLRDD